MKTVNNGILQDRNNLKKNDRWNTGIPYDDINIELDSSDFGGNIANGADSTIVNITSTTWGDITKNFFIDGIIIHIYRPITGASGTILRESNTWIEIEIKRETQILMRPIYWYPKYPTTYFDWTGFFNESGESHAYQSQIGLIMNEFYDSITFLPRKIANDETLSITIINRTGGNINIEARVHGNVV